VAHQSRPRELLLKVFNETDHRFILRFSPVVFRFLRAIRHPPNPRDTDRMGIVTFNMGARSTKGATIFDRTVSTNDVVIPDIGPSSFFDMPFSNFFHANI